MPILAAFMVPHPPMIVPDIGRGSEAQITETIRAYEQVADEIAALRPETIIIASPHATLYSRDPSPISGLRRSVLRNSMTRSWSIRSVFLPRRPISLPEHWASVRRSWITGPWSRSGSSAGNIPEAGSCGPVFPDCP